MEIDLEQRTLVSGFGELAGFHIRMDAPHGLGLRVRAEIGTEWHEELRGAAARSAEPWQFEAPAQLIWKGANWNFRVSGRMDQWLPRPNGGRIREIKTIRRPLPCDAEELRLHYPQHFNQVVLYLLAAQQAASSSVLSAFEAELLFVDISSGMQQCVPVETEDIRRAEQHLRSTETYWEDRRRHRLALGEMPVPRPFEIFRQGQEAVRRELGEALRSAAKVCLEAPTGFGKSGLVVEQALTALQTARADRVLFLTARNTGHTPLLHHIRSAWRNGAQAFGMPILSRKELEPDDLWQSQTTPTRIQEDWEQFQNCGIPPRDFFEEGILGKGRLVQQAHAIQISAHNLQRFLLAHADFWVGDLNYAFDPGARSALQLWSEGSSMRTLLLVDEAHHLARRVSDCLSFSIQQEELDSLDRELGAMRFPGRLGRLVSATASYLRQYRMNPENCLSPTEEADWIAQLTDCAEAWETAFWETDSLSEDSLELLLRFRMIGSVWRDPLITHCLRVPAKGTLSMDCLSADRYIRSVLDQFTQVVFMSATLSPISWSLAQWGYAENEVQTICGQAQWLEDRFTVIADQRVDTRFQSRRKSIPLTANTIGQTALRMGRPLGVFFPSYAYAESVKEIVLKEFPVLRCALQPRNTNLAEQWHFLESSLLASDVLFLILGSRFAEGIDALGGRIREAIVVSPSLPEPSALQKMRTDANPSNSGYSPFEENFIIPGMQKIQQALGRLVRDPSHNARVLLHCQRFTNPAYNRFLPHWLQPSESIQDRDAFDLLWLNALGE